MTAIYTAVTPIVRTDTAGRAAAPSLWIAALAVCLTLPAFFREPMVHDSFWIDQVWAEGFYRQLAGGSLYPRWLDQAHGGLGAPVFYFYAPLSFYMTALFQALGFTPYGAVMATFGVALAGSGFAMYQWLKDRAPRPLLGALLYMALPYHLCDLYERGALAEFCAFALLPALALGLRRASEGRGFALLAWSYAALICTHLPVALLISLLLVAPYGLGLCRQQRCGAPAIAAGLLAGLMISAAYLIPALSLQEHVAIGHLWRATHLQPNNWILFRPSDWPAPIMAAVILPILLGVGLAGGLLLARERRNRWALYSLVIALIVAGAVPGFWSLPLISKVQFPWRALVLVEFGLATAIAMSSLPMGRLLALSAPLLTVSLAQLSASHERPERLEEAIRRHADVPEYLPRGAPSEFAPYSAWALQIADNAKARSSENGLPPTFYFPAWQVTCAGVPVAGEREPETGLLVARGRDCRAERQLLPAERAGLLGSILAILALAVALVLQGRGRLAGPSSSIPETRQRVASTSDQA